MIHRILLLMTRNGIPFSTFHGRESTIYALSTGGIRCAVAVIRVSGSQATTVLKRIGNFSKLPEPRRAIFRKLYDPLASTWSNSSVIDHGIVLWFPGPSSYSGEDSCEFQIHGGPAVVTALLKAISVIPDCRMAEPGEFTKRAFLNGKMDLTEIDGLGDLITAETEMQRLQALRQMSGSLGELYESWRDRIAKMLANAEAYIDFGEDENIEDDIMEKIAVDVQCAVCDIKLHLSDSRKGERLRSGVHVAIVGRPNVGKSSLLNLLCKRNAAIVSAIPGTTRDVVETTVNLSGYPVIFADTAGVRNATGDEIEMEGIRRARDQVVKADLVILVLDSNLMTCTSGISSINELIEKELQEVCYQNDADVDLKELRSKVMIVFNKVDLNTFNLRLEETEASSTGLHNADNSGISCKTNQGIPDFLEKLSGRVASLCADPKSESVCLTQERYRSHLENCVNNLEAYLESTTNTGDLAIRTQLLKNAMNSIGYITGHFGTEDILDILFRNFCIGK